MWVALVMGVGALGLGGCGAEAQGPTQWQMCCCDEESSSPGRGPAFERRQPALPSDGGSDAEAAAEAQDSGTGNGPSLTGRRIMPLGDSITNGDGSPGGWRVRYWKLAAGASPGIDFRGSLTNGPAALPDKDHEGHSGKRIEQLRELLVAGAWVKTHQPDLVLLMAGANDLIQNFQIDAAHERLRELILEIHNQKPSAWIVVSTTTVINEVGAESRATAYNAKLPAMVGQLAGEGVPVELVDMHAALTVGDIDSGGVHPTPTGYDKLGQAWFDATRELLGL